jgi:hypothetical protein
MLAELIVPSKTPGTAPRDSIRDEAFNIGKNGENYRIRDAANMVAERAFSIGVRSIRRYAGSAESSFDFIA